MIFNLLKYVSNVPIIWNTNRLSNRGKRISFSNLLKGIIFLNDIVIVAWRKRVICSLNIKYPLRFLKISINSESENDRSWFRILKRLTIKERICVSKGYL